MLNGLCCRTINSYYDQTNFSVIPTSGTVALSIQCAELVGHESQLAERSFKSTLRYNSSIFLQLELEHHHLQHQQQHLHQHLPHLYLQHHPRLHHLQHQHLHQHQQTLLLHHHHHHHQQLQDLLYNHLLEYQFQCGVVSVRLYK